RARRVPSARAEELIVSDDVGEQLVALVERMRRRGRALHAAAGGAVTAPAGVAALVTGPEGAGKRMLTSVLADALSLPLYAVDLRPFGARWGAAAEAELLALLHAAAVAPLLLLLEHAEACPSPALAALLESGEGLVVVASVEPAPRARRPFA